MKVCVFGLWHLGSTTAGCLAHVGHDVVGLDLDASVVSDLQNGRAPLLEPNLDELIESGISTGKLRFTSVLQDALSEAEVIWVTIDTPVDEDDDADIDAVFNDIKLLLKFIPRNTLILVSSQIPVGSTRNFENMARNIIPEKEIKFAYSPENLRLGKAIEVFLDPDRIIVGVRDEKSQATLHKLLTPITDRIEWMSVESAEMTKHAINSFLATSITFTNELASICELVGADAKEVERGLKTERRIGGQAYVSPGAAFAGGTLARDVAFLNSAAKDNKLPTPLLSSIRVSNDMHKNWHQRKLRHIFGESLSQLNVAIWGLTYKSGTSTLRRSLAVELCDWLLVETARLNVFDPAVKIFPDRWQGKISFSSNALDAVADAKVLVICTEWPEFRSAASQLEDFASEKLIIIDANRFLWSEVRSMHFEYFSVGSAELSKKGR